MFQTSSVLPDPMSFFFVCFLNKVVFVPFLWMHKGWHLYCTDKVWHLYEYKAGHRSMCASLLFHLYFCCSLYCVIRVLSWETSKASKSFTFPPSDPLHFMFWLSRKIFFHHSSSGDPKILISVERIFSQVSQRTSGNIAFVSTLLFYWANKSIVVFCCYPTRVEKWAQ